MNLRELKKIVASGESDRLEFKTSTGQRTRAMKTVCGMLNGLGGFVLFGISDKGEIRGQEVTAKTLESLASELGRIDPPVFPDVETIAMGSGKAVVALRIPGGGLYTYDSRPYVRRGPTTSLMPREEYERRVIERLHSTNRWENEPAPSGISLKDLDEDEIHLTLSNAIDTGRMRRPPKTDTRSILTGLGLMVDGMLSNAAVVLYGKSARFEPRYPQCAIQMARFRGIDRLADFADSRQHWGNSFSILRQAESFFLDHLPVSGRVVAGETRRRDMPMYHPRAIREALANAICHRDYTVAGANVSLAIFDDRMEIANPGSLHFGITPEKLFEPHESRPWNPVIANVFYRSGIIEKWGTGTLNIIAWNRENGNPPPEWSAGTNTVTVTFRLPPAGIDRRPESQPESQPVSRPELQPGLPVGSLRDRVIVMLRNGPLSKSEISKQLGQKQISGQLKKVLREMIAEGILSFTLPDKPKSRLQKYRLTKKNGKGIP